MNFTKTDFELGILIPLYHGRGGIGKTYHADKIAPLICNWFNKPLCKYVKYSCTNGNDFDLQDNRNAFGLIAEGFLMHVVRDAKEDENTAYYVVLDEVFNLENVRASLGYLFSEKKPENMYILVTGNSSSLYDMTEKQLWITDTGVRRRFHRLNFEKVFDKENALISFVDNLKEVSEDKFFYNLYKRIYLDHKIEYHEIDFNIVSSLVNHKEPVFNNTLIEIYCDLIMKSLYLEEYEAKDKDAERAYKDNQKYIRGLLKNEK